LALIRVKTRRMTEDFVERLESGFALRLAASV
jgi:hypothetical protein